MGPHAASRTSRTPGRRSNEPSDHPRSFVVGMGAYFVLVALGTGLLSLIDDPPTALAVVAALLPVAAAAYAIAGQFRSMRSQEGVERIVYTDSAAVAFFVLALSALSWFFLEAFADAPRLSALVPWFYGMAVWFVALVVLGRRYR